MGGWVKSKAEEIRGRSEGLLPSQIAEAEGIDVVEVEDMPRRIGDMYALGTMVLPAGLPRPERELRIAHCLGHHFQHSGNQVWFQVLGIWFRGKQEWEADEFAAWLVSPEVRSRCHDCREALAVLRNDHSWLW